MQALDTRAWDSRAAVWRLAFVVCALLLALTMMAGRAVAAPPPANSVIGNQASATYTDASGNSRSATSNLVNTTVQQVYSHTLVADVTKYVAPGGTAYLPFTLTNTGNGNDSYNLSTFQLTTDQFNLGSLVIYADANGDGQPDNFTPITSTGVVPAGQAFRFVVAGTVPASQPNNNEAHVRIGAAGNVADLNNYAASATAPAGSEQGVLGIAKVSTGGVINVTKSFSVTTGPVNNTLTVTLTYTNTGSAPATSVNLKDVIGSGDTAELAYAGNLKWNNSAVTVAAGAISGTGISGTVPTAAAGQVDVTIASVAQGQSGTISFDVNVVNATPGAEKTKNVASYTWTGVTTPLNTNQAIYTVNVAGTAAVAIGDQNATGTTPVITSNGNNNNGTTAGSLADANGPSNPVTGDNGVQIASAVQGATLVYHVVVSNTGSASDSFDLTYANGSFPAGTTFQYINAAGVPLVDTNGNGVPDTGPMTPGSAMSVYIRVVLPPAAIVTTTSTATLTAASHNNASVSDVTTVILSQITARQLDLTNVTSISDTGPGTGVGFLSGDGLAAPSTTLTANPGNSVTFYLRVANNTGVADNFNLQVFGSYTHNATAADVTGALPAGWTVVFRNAGGAVVTNTGNIPAGAAANFEAVVTAPANAAPGNHDFFFRAWSAAFGQDGATEGGFDVKLDRVTVNRVATLSLTPNNTRQIFPGGSADLGHQLCLSGNVSVDATGINLAATSVQGWSSVIYVDANQNGIYDTGEAVYTAAASASLAPGSCISLVVRVFAPSGATDGSAETITLTATGNSVAPAMALTATAQDVLNVVAGNLVLLKEQQTVDCATGTAQAPQAAFTQGQINNLPPGSCLKYRVTVTNMGSDVANNIVVTDTTPTYSAYHAAGSCAAVASQGTLTAPANGSSGNLAFTMGTLAAGANATASFCVQINN